MPLGPDDRVEIARRAPVRPGITFARDTNTLPVARPGLDPHLERLSFFDHARAMASRTLHIKLHPAAGLRDLPRPAALRTFSRRFQKSLSVAVPASVVTRNIQSHHPAADRCPERHVDLIFQISARFRTFLGSRRAASSTKHTAEDVAEAAASATTFAAAAWAIG